MRVLIVLVLVLVGCRVQGGGGERCLQCEELKGGLLLVFEERVRFGVGEVEAGQASLVWVEGSLELFKGLLVDSKVRADLRERAVRDEFAGVEARLGWLVDSGGLTEGQAGVRLEECRAGLVVRLALEKKEVRERELGRLRRFEQRENVLLGRVRRGELTDEQGLLELREFWVGLRAEDSP